MISVSDYFHGIAHSQIPLPEFEEKEQRLRDKCPSIIMLGLTKMITKVDIISTNDLLVVLVTSLCAYAMAIGSAQPKCLIRANINVGLMSDPIYVLRVAWTTEHYNGRTMSECWPLFSNTAHLSHVLQHLVQIRILAGVR